MFIGLCNLEHGTAEIYVSRPERDVRGKWPLCEYGEQYLDPFFLLFLGEGVTQNEAWQQQKHNPTSSLHTFFFGKFTLPDPVTIQFNSKNIICPQVAIKAP